MQPGVKKDLRDNSIKEICKSEEFFWQRVRQKRHQIYYWGNGAWIKDIPYYLRRYRTNLKLISLVKKHHENDLMKKKSKFISKC